MGVKKIWNEIPKDSLERLYDGMTRLVLTILTKIIYMMYVC